MWSTISIVWNLDLLSDSVVSSDQLLRETSETDQWNHFKTDFTGLLHWFPEATDLVARMSHRVDRGLSNDKTVLRISRASTKHRQPSTTWMLLCTIHFCGVTPGSSNIDLQIQRYVHSFSRFVTNLDLFHISTQVGQSFESTQNQQRYFHHNENMPTEFCC